MRGVGGYTRQTTRGGLLLVDDLPASIVRVHFSPAVIGTNETKLLYRVKKGMRVVSASLRQGVSAAGGATSTWSIGDATSNVGYLAATTTVAAAKTLTDGVGAYVTSAAGKIYTAMDSVNLYYLATATPGATYPSCDVRLVLQQEWPEV